MATLATFYDGLHDSCEQLVDYGGEALIEFITDRAYRLTDRSIKDGLVLQCLFILELLEDVDHEFMTIVL